MSETNKVEYVTSLRRFKPYPAYKDSGVEWLGKIPAHWEVKRLKRLAGLRAGMAITSESIEENGDYPVFGGNGIRGFTSSYTHEGEFPLIGRQGALCGCVNFASGRFWASEHAVVASPQPEVEAGWLTYLLHAMSLNSYSESAAQPGLAVETISVLPVPVPASSEQRAIAAFLDRETAKIDALVAKKERLIELLQEKRTALITRAVTKGLDPNVPMKDSGVEWLDKYPAHWTGLPLKRWVKVKITDGPHETPELLTEGVDFVSAEAVTEGRIEFEKRRGFISAELHAYYCRKCRPVRDDILLCKSGATTGKLARVDVDFEFSVWSPLALVRASRTRILPTFLEMALRSEYVQDQIKRTWSAGTQPNISMGDLEQLFVVAPPLEEQSNILQYLSHETGGFDLLIARVSEGIDRIKELRTALVSAAVTGKIDVRGEAAALDGAQITP